jgi:hypothetical protein
MIELPRWAFEQDEEGHWYWRRIDATSCVRSELAFSQRIECVLDAIRHGIRLRRTLEERKLH